MRGKRRVGKKKRRGVTSPDDGKGGSFLPQMIGVSGGVAIASVAFWFFRKQADRVVEGRAETLDMNILHTARMMTSPAADQLMRAATYMGTHVAVGTAAGVTAIAMMKRGRPADAWTVIISTGGAMAVNSVLKSTFRRERPQQLRRLIRLPKSHSFPSGHSLMAAATFPIMAHHLVQNESLPVQAGAQAAAGLTILSVGASRIYFGVHFPSDVLAGFAAGFGWLGLTSLSHTLIEAQRALAKERRREAKRRKGHRRARSK